MSGITSGGDRQNCSSTLQGILTTLAAGSRKRSMANSRWVGGGTISLVICDCTSRRNQAFLGGEIQLKMATMGTRERVSLSSKANDSSTGPACQENTTS